MSKKTLQGLASLAAISAIAGYFICLAPYMTDNFIFSRHITPGYAAFYAGAPIQASALDLASAFSQAAELWRSWCGRFAGNLAVFLLFLLPRWLYCLFASCLFGFYVFLLQLCVFGREWRQNLSAGWLWATAALLWLGMPSFGEAFLWLSVGGQIALLGQALVFLPFRFAIGRPHKENRLLPLECAGLFCLGVIAASLDFATSAALPPTALGCSLLLWKQRRRIPWPCLCCALGLCAGAAATILAPGNAQRLLLTRDDTVIAWLAMPWMERGLNWLAHLPLAVWMQIIPLLLLAWAWMALRESPEKRLSPAAWLFLAPCLLTHAAYFFTAWPAPRAFATCSAQLIIAALIACRQALPLAGAKALRRLAAMRAMLAIGCVATLAWEGAQFQILHGEMRERERIIAAAAGGDALVPPLKAASSSWQTLGNELMDISADPAFWVNRAQAAWHGLRSIALAPQAPATFALPQDHKLSPEQAAWIDRLEIRLDGGKIKVRSRGDAQAGAPAILRFYYPGKPGVLHYFPPFISRPVARWLARGGPDGWRAVLAPLLLARADVPLTDGAGQSILLKLEGEPALWLVRPGDGKASFNLTPLAREENVEGK